MLTLNLITFVVVALLGLVGNLKAYKANAFQSWNIWLWDVVLVLALSITWNGVAS